MLNLEVVRSQFPAFQRTIEGQPVAFFDGPAGSQVPQSVVDAVADALINTNANCGAAFVTSQLSDAMLAQTRESCADFLNAQTPEEIVFGPNMTTLTLSLSRALSETWFYGDEIIVSRLDHDANVTPWVQAAESVGVVVKQIDFDLETCTLDMDHYNSLLTNRTRLVAVGGASNATGTVNPVQEIVRLAKTVGARTFVDAVHLAPHRLVDVQEIGSDFLACSAYKFFGPHVGILWGKSTLLNGLTPDKLRPAPNSIPGKWMTGTQNHEGIAGVAAAIEYLASLSGGDQSLPRRERLTKSFQLIYEHEQKIGLQLIEGLSKIESLKIWGITSPEQMEDRVPTISVTHQSKSPQFLSEELGRRGLFTWAGNHYALPFTEFAGLEPEGTLRIGLLHYNSAEEVERLLFHLNEIC
ncbi:cysteine desulfurase-like protein [Thalassoglobus sp.]|uniref:cysteine desulfurase-like protein n=1 Tax=Thalassoglobus sp. TaxID=2795869 RepID=UPI003AA97AA7